MVKLVDVILSAAFPVLVLVHLVAAPYTKVEESFNIQAIHDVLTYGIPNPIGPGSVDYIRDKYDHASFPGSVPRTFVGATLLAGLSRPLVRFVESPEQVQLLVRGILGLLNAVALVRFRAAVDVAYGRTAGRFYLTFLACQFQLLFYASRTLPNYLALPLTTEASRAFLLSLSSSSKPRASSKRRRLSLYLLTVSTIIFRSEVALLLATTAGTLFLFSGLDIRNELIPAGFAGAIIALTTTLSLDTFLWRPRIALSLTYKSGDSLLQLPLPTWPELQAFLYNTVEGHSSEWGTSPFHYYFSSALPKLLLNPLHLLLIPASFAIPAIRRTSINSLLPSLTFILLFSLLPHKEPRFIIYTLPLLLASSSATASYLFTRSKKSSLYRLLTLLLLLSLPLSLTASTALLWISTHNYPGGHALSTLHAMSSPTSLTTSIPLQLALHNNNNNNNSPSSPARPRRPLTKSGVARAVAASAAARQASSALRDRGHVAVHLDNLAAQTGVTRFQERYRQRGVVIGSAAAASGAAGGGGGDWVYDKTEDPSRLADPLFWETMDFVVCERPEKVPGSWEVLDAVWAFEGVGLKLASADGSVVEEEEEEEEERKGDNGQMHDLQRERTLLVPELPGWSGERFEGWMDGIARSVARRTGGRWPHVRLRKKLFLLKRGVVA